MDERELRAFHRAAQPILQRTAPPGSQSGVRITPPVLEQIAWGVVLAYVANVGRQLPPAIPQGAQEGERPLRDEEVRLAVDSLKQANVRLQPTPPAVARFAAAASHLLEAYGWAPPRADQAAGELAEALREASGH